MFNFTSKLFYSQAGLLGSYDGYSGRGICGGSLVTANRVITAAHCWFDGQNQANQFEVVLGSITLFSGGTRLTTTNVVVHPNWSPSEIRNDVAVVYLPSSVSFSGNLFMLFVIVLFGGVTKIKLLS